MDCGQWTHIIMFCNHLLVDCGQWTHIYLCSVSIRYMIGPICRGSALRPSMQSTFPIFSKGFFSGVFVSGSRTSIIANTLLGLFLLMCIISSLQVLAEFWVDRLCTYLLEIYTWLRLHYSSPWADRQDYIQI